MVIAPSPSSGHRILFGRLRGTPMTMPVEEAVDDALADVARCAAAGLRERPVLAAMGRDRFSADDARAVARWDVHSAFAGARDFFAVTNGFGPRPLPAAISSIDRPEATDASSSKILFFFPSRANSSRCLIRSQLVRFSPSRFRIRVRIQPPCSFS